MLTALLGGIGAFVVAACWVVGLRNWRWAVIALILFIPFGGLLQLWFGTNFVLAKDILFVLPAYVGLLVSKFTFRSAGPEQVCLLLFAMLTFWVGVELCNPSAPPFLAALIGVKVWIFYIPFLFVGMAFVRTRSDLVFVFRLLVASAWMPCLLGIVEFIASYRFGYENTMYAIYGPAAIAATQGFTKFEIGGSLIRIPSSFTFPAQYYNFLLCAITMSYAASQIDSSRKWRTAANVTCAVVGIAAIISGVRASFMFTPFLFFVMCLLDGRMFRFFGAIALFGVVGTAALSISGIDPVGLWNLLTGLTRHYGEDNTLGYVAQHLSLFGNGTGSGTGATRYVLGPTTEAIPESYYAKAAYELGAVGLVVIIVLLAVIVWFTLMFYLEMPKGPMRSVAAALCGFVITIAIYLFKGVFVDLDPLNVYFWFIVGIAFRLPSLVGQQSAVFRATLRTARVAAYPA